MDINDITGLILKKAFEVHSTLGPGLLESAYEECLFYELSQCNLLVERQKALPIIYKRIKVDAGYRLDIVVNNCVSRIKISRDVTPYSYFTINHLLKTI